jgi:hypothetical protein
MPEMTPTRFIIFSLPRSGSTALRNALNCHPGVRCVSEPFNPQRFNGRFHNPVKDDKSLDECLDRIWAEWNGIKHVCDWTGWPFVHNPQINARILARPGTRVLFLVRRNFLRRLLSWQLATEIGVWDCAKATAHSRLEQVQLKPMDSGWAREQVKQDRQAVENYSRVLAAHNVPVLDIAYEDFFREDASDSYSLEQVNTVLRFLQCEPIEAEVFRDKWKRHFNNGSDRFSSVGAYRSFPGIERIEEEVGSNENGWLFR